MLAVDVVAVVIADLVVAHATFYLGRAEEIPAPAFLTLCHIFVSRYSPGYRRARNVRRDVLFLPFLLFPFRLAAENEPSKPDMFRERARPFREDGKQDRPDEDDGERVGKRGEKERGGQQVESNGDVQRDADDREIEATSARRPRVIRTSVATRRGLLRASRVAAGGFSPMRDITSYFIHKSRRTPGVSSSGAFSFYEAMIPHAHAGNCASGGFSPLVFLFYSYFLLDPFCFVLCCARYVPMIMKVA